MSIIVIILVIIVFVILAANIFMRQPSFGSASSGKRLERMLASPNYRNGQFQNLSKTPALTEGVSYWAVIKEFFFAKKERRTPAQELPSKKADLLHLDANEDVLVWFGHSSYFMQVDGKKILVDPVFSGHASPVNFTTPAFKGTDAYSADDLPEIDYLFITHDHWDHLDYRTVVALKPKVKTIITGLGVGAHLERWGYEHSTIIEKDWNEEIMLDNEFVINTAPARHFSGRGLKRNGTLWSSFVFTTPTRRIYIGGDSGYDTHFKTIGENFGPFDLVILENGQYDKSWKYIHMMPEQVVQAAHDLKAALLFPVHWSKFPLGNHAWDEPIIRVAAEAKRKGMPLIHPMIGEQVLLKEGPVNAAEWWTGIT
jgi:L-ascorbate metabolism protein UlaG (beta-lactamase superfamily)